MASKRLSTRKLEVIFQNHNSHLSIYVLTLSNNSIYTCNLASPPKFNSHVLGFIQISLLSTSIIQIFLNKIRVQMKEESICLKKHGTLPLFHL